MDRLPRHLQCRIFSLSVQLSTSPIDQKRLLGIPPGQLALPPIHVSPKSHSHGTGFATLRIKLPRCKEYCIQRVVHYSLPDGALESPRGRFLWESCSLNILRGHPDLPTIFEGEQVERWRRGCVGGFLLETPALG